MEVSRQLHAPVDLAQENEPRCPFKRRLGEPNFRYGHFGEGTKFVAANQIRTPDFPAPSQTVCSLQLQRRLRRGSEAARLLGLRV